MHEIFMYLIGMAACLFGYRFLLKERYFREDNTHAATGIVRDVLVTEKTEQYQIMFIDHEGEQQVALSPKYAKNERQYEVGEEIPIRYLKLNFKIQKKGVLSIRIMNPELVKCESYGIFLRAAGLFFVLACLKVFLLITF